MQVEDDPVPVPLQRAVDVAAQDLAVQEADSHLSGRRLGDPALGQRQLHPLDRGQGHPRHLVVVDAADILDLDDEIGLVEIQVLRPPLEGLVVEETNVDLQLSSLSFDPNVRQVGVLRRRRFTSARPGGDTGPPSLREQRTHPARCRRTASA